MTHKISAVSVLPDHRLSVRFAEGATKIYDVKPLFDRIPVFAELRDPEKFSRVSADTGGYGIVWNDNADLSSDELWQNSTTINSFN